MVGVEFALWTPQVLSVPATLKIIVAARASEFVAQTWALDPVCGAFESEGLAEALALPCSQLIYLLLCSDAERDAELTTEMRRRNGAAGVVALVTGGALGAKGRLLECGADACVDFPCEAPTVEMWIRAIARRLLGDWSLMREGFQLDPGEGELRLGAKTFRFRPTEYRVCEYLVMNRGRWVSERELLRAVLDVRHDRETSLVRVHVRHIRKALGELRECITSRRGHGYQFQLPSSAANEGRGAGTVERACAKGRDEARVERMRGAVATWERGLRRLA